MKVVLLTGNHPRHQFVLRELLRTSYLCGVVIEHREDHVPNPPEGLSPHLSDLFIRHFKERSLAEEKWFGSAASDLHPTISVPLLQVSREQLNSKKTTAFLRQLAPDGLLSYGVHKLAPELLQIGKAFSWNVHGGLSPWYRGVATHFWPSYFLEPQMTGMTLHETTEAIDGGAVIHQTAADLVRGDGLHDLACRAVSSLIEELPDVLALAEANRLKPASMQATSGRVWLERDWRPEHLQVIYDLYNNRIVDHALDGLFSNRAANLVRQF